MKYRVGGWLLALALPADVCKPRSNVIIDDEHESDHNRQITQKIRVADNTAGRWPGNLLAGVRLRVRQVLGRRVAAAAVGEMRPDVVIVATGATPLMPRIAGIECVEADHRLGCLARA